MRGWSLQEASTNTVVIHKVPRVRLASTGQPTLEACTSTVLELTLINPASPHSLRVALCGMLFVTRSLSL